MSCKFSAPATRRIFPSSIKVKLLSEVEISVNAIPIRIIIEKNKMPVLMPIMSSSGPAMIGRTILGRNGIVTND